MAVTANKAAPPRWHLTFEGPDTLADDLGSIGAWVGPRTGPDKRDHGQMEDYVLRRLLVAWREFDRLSFPVEITAANDEPGEPDFLLAWTNGETVGVEVTQAGTEEYHAQLTRFDKEGPGSIELTSVEGFAGDSPERMAAKDICEAIRRKITGFNHGKYHTADSCDLLVYDNTEYGQFADKRALINEIRRDSNLIGGFRHIHLVIGEFVYIDIFGNDSLPIDVGKTYEIDYAAWIFDQIERMRDADRGDLDLTHISEELADLGRSERRALGSHLKNLLIHLLKWQIQPERRGSSWRTTIENTRSEIHEILTEMPSLQTYFKTRVPTEYKRARKEAARETNIDIEQLPVIVPYTHEQLIDPEFLPDEDV